MKTLPRKITLKSSQNHQGTSGWSAGGPTQQYLINGKTVQSPVDLANEQMRYYVYQKK